MKNLNVNIRALYWNRIRDYFLRKQGNPISPRVLVFQDILSFPNEPTPFGSSHYLLTEWLLQRSHDPNIRFVSPDENCIQVHRLIVSPFIYQEIGYMRKSLATQCLSFMFWQKNISTPIPSRRKESPELFAAIEETSCARTSMTLLNAIRPNFVQQIRYFVANVNGIPYKHSFYRYLELCGDQFRITGFDQAVVPIVFQNGSRY